MLVEQPPYTDKLCLQILQLPFLFFPLHEPDLSVIVAITFLHQQNLTIQAQFHTPVAEGVVYVVVLQM